ncbi:conserved hypothetical protein [Perkinsus marinus ATCC 50983]|uniref:Uncharacterized protein n=1 Tax=Perkinsus marinus (strain ATCC 50983 / TXsc) TaxID=423536 RepID=C5KRG4_PERM5|nr:conserved hypothetical protein [Perkinsus marinus ATCC 50983]EER12937.1 conserved hypothetical protein [Perkinsus marinus ATCC 50983]|eukprot:XP_002781142.1 conserved hypothetical protein [Perkinsus marinus ATCC 50983]
MQAPVVESSLLLELNARLEDGQVALLDQISMQSSWIAELREKIADQEKQLSRMGALQRSVETMDRKNANALKKCNRMHEAKLSDVRQGEAVHADRIRAAEERAARSEKYIRAMNASLQTQSLRERDEKVRQQSLELQHLRNEMRERDIILNLEKEDDEKAGAEIKVQPEEGDQTEGLASVRKEVLLKALESRDAIIKGLNERLSYMIDRERTINMERIGEAREKKRSSAELEDCKAELGKAYVEIERLRRKLPTEGKDSEVSAKFPQLRRHEFSTCDTSTIIMY